MCVVEDAIQIWNNSPSVKPKDSSRFCVYFMYVSFAIRFQSFQGVLPFFFCIMYINPAAQNPNGLHGV